MTRFIVSPGLSRRVVERALELGVAVLPGVASASEIMAALDLGLSTVKYFPAEVCGGPAEVRALAAPFLQVRFVPTGGITATSMLDYPAAPAVAAVGGSRMVSRTYVARGLRRCFGLRTAVVTAFADNEVGRLLEDLVLVGGVDTSLVRWVPYDGIGRPVRNGLNVTERGFGVRGAVGVSDRRYTAAATLRPKDADWDELFGRYGVRWLHTGGIYAGRCEGTPEVILAAMQAARRHGTAISYDLNYRPSPWQAIVGSDRARAVNGRLVELVDVLLGNEEDFTAALGFTVQGTGPGYTDLDAGAFRAMIGQVTQRFSGVQVISTTLRQVRSALRR